MSWLRVGLRQTIVPSRQTDRQTLLLPFVVLARGVMSMHVFCGRVVRCRPTSGHTAVCVWGAAIGRDNEFTSTNQVSGKTSCAVRY